MSFFQNALQVFASTKASKSKVNQKHSPNQGQFPAKCLSLMLAAAFSTAIPSHEVQAASVGNVRKIENVNGQSQLSITTDKGNLIQISILRSDLFRVWAGSDAKLVDAGDKAAPIVLKQDFGKVDFTVQEQSDYLLVKTKDMALRIYRQPLRLALYRADNRTMLWQELQALDIGEKRSFQTLSSSADEAFFGGGQQNGNYAFKGKTLEVSYSGGWEENDRPSPAPFYMSSKGYGVLRNTWSNGSYDFRSNDFITSSHNEKRFDAYYFVGDSIKDVLNGYTTLTGRARMLPRWAYEYGDADCYNDGDNVKKPGTFPKAWSDGPTGKTPDVILSVAAKYREHDMPGGWILPNDGYGCGYTDLEAVVKGLKQYGFRTGLWTENGVDKIKWEVGTAGTRAQKLDVAWTGQGYQFALDANQAAAQGILDNSNSRPFIWTVMGWAGMQRYAVTWTGDQSGSWDYIRWHIPTLIGSGLSGQAYATGDVDGIFGGSPETFTRDLQWKAFTPVLMGMSGWSQNVRKHPWAFDEPYRSINRDYLKLKMRLMPYMYTLAQETEMTGAPIVRGLMWDHPQDPHANDENYKYQFFLGKDLLVAPVYRSQAASQGWRKGVYLPQGQWIDYWDGRVVTAGTQGKLIDYQVSLDKLPVMVRAGAILPMYPSALYDGQVAKDVLTWDIYPHGESNFTLYEDDGETRQYQQGEKSTQQIRVFAPENKAGLIQIKLDGVRGQYQGMETQRVQVFQVHTRVKPSQVLLQKQALAELVSRAEFEKANTGWYYDAAHQYGVVYVKTAKLDVRQALAVDLDIPSTASLASTADYPAAPATGDVVPADSLIVLNRSAEEPGHPVENAFDGKPGTWFRTLRDQSQKTGPHEFTLALGERRLIKGFEIAPRNDKHWDAGQVKDFEVYMADTNGEWGQPIYVGQLKKQEGKQRVEFPAKAGRLFRFRILSSHDQAEDGNVQDPMVLTSNDASAGNAPRAYNAFTPIVVPPVTISEFHLLEQQNPDKPALQSALSDFPFAAAKGTVVAKDKVMIGKVANATKHETMMQMNGLKFRKGLGVSDVSEITYRLQGNWQIFRADVGIDDACRQNGGLQFQVYGDGKLLFDSGLIEAPAVVKPELDIRGISKLSLRTTGVKAKAKAPVCANWANATVIGFAGDTIVK
ncbi:glycoside hydrolase family 31 protein [Undibacterium cyanobacteriorum]|uniref:Glycoside hydrolase family 31 protein n=1 Tax=Undibacterium cyanobacteriorum TaxID=3073561 RepID=A0ABY9RK05_9BURK|nr:TIM-barrel domain-containing protein [Undibacterium sp. 20NA77.5]WMW81527.1 glycoside hydrolase family 31 protein [Undibacterium sp. 20NA77.5]